MTNLKGKKFLYRGLPYNKGFNPCPSKCGYLKVSTHDFCGRCTAAGTTKKGYYIFDIECYCGKQVNKYNIDSHGWNHDSCDQKYHKLDNGIPI